MTKKVEIAYFALQKSPNFVQSRKILRSRSAEQIHLFRKSKQHIRYISHSKGTLKDNERKEKKIFL